MSIIGDLKEVGSVLQKAGNIELYQKIIEVQEKILDYQEENQQLKSDNRKLREALETKETLRFEKGLYWKENDAHPFCQVCFDKDEKLIRVKSLDHGIWYCDVCKSSRDK